MRLLVFLMLLPGPGFAESLIALRTIPAKSVIAVEDMGPVDAEIAGAITDAALVAGQEARVTVYAGRPIRVADFGPPALVDRNQIVALIYVAGGLQITAEGRAMDRGGTGDAVRVMNLGSRTLVSGIVTETGAVRVGMAP
ncbi:MAG: flagellar basal body P-ring formation chaperone FlgA [Paracoccaceae bacterium]